jgi:hypothetical protein
MDLWKLRERLEHRLGERQAAERRLAELRHQLAWQAADGDTPITGLLGAFGSAELFSLAQQVEVLDLAIGHLEAEVASASAHEKACHPGRGHVPAYDDPVNVHARMGRRPGGPESIAHR